MSELQQQFERATIQAKDLPQRPDNETMLRLYSLYKQATAGDVSGKRPGFTDFVGRAKYDAWAALRGHTREQAQQAYVTLVQQLSGSASDE